MSVFGQRAASDWINGLDFAVPLAPKPGYVILTLILVAWLIATCLWLVTAEYQRRVTVTGWLAASGGAIDVYPPHVGRITNLRVREGELVESGQVLLQIHREKLTGEGSSGSSQIRDEISVQLATHEARLQRLAHYRVLSLAQAQSDLESAKEELALIIDQIDLHDMRTSFHLKQTRRLIELADRELVAPSELENQRLVDIENQGISTSLRREQAVVRSRIAASEKAIVVDAIRIEDEEDAIRTAISDLKLQLIQLSIDEGTTVTAPSDGVIHNLSVRNGMDSHSGNTPLLTIFPQNSELEAKIHVPDSARGLIREGQPLRLRFSAFPHQRYGVMSGEITYIADSAASLESSQFLAGPSTMKNYKARARLERQRMGKHPLLPGMTFQADITLDSISLINVLLGPLYTFRDSLQK